MTSPSAASPRPTVQWIPNFGASAASSALAEEQGNPVSKDEIIQKVWKERYSVGDNTIEVYINLLRNKIDKPFNNKLIHTKVGFGYYLSQEN